MPVKGLHIVVYWILSIPATLTFGDYPLVSLKDARKKRDDARRLLADNIDPDVERDIWKLSRASSPSPTTSTSPWTTWWDGQTIHDLTNNYIIDT
jgi:hypothetical protein